MAGLTLADVVPPKPEETDEAPPAVPLVAEPGPEVAAEPLAVEEEKAAPVKAVEVHPSPQTPTPYRGTSLVRNRTPHRPYCRPVLRALWLSWGWGAASFERCTPVTPPCRYLFPTSPSTFRRPPPSRSLSLWRRRRCIP